jgi:hypothetical protein
MENMRDFEIRLALAVQVKAADPDEALKIAETIKQTEAFGGHEIIAVGPAWICEVLDEPDKEE